MYRLSHPLHCLFFLLTLATPLQSSPTKQLPFSTKDMDLSITNPIPASNSTIYFGYGSNLWLHQMDLRCPTSRYLGVARLSGYKWIINDRGYANIVEVSENDTVALHISDADDNYSNVVFGLVYSLQTTDEARLDVNEGVPIAYTKEQLPCDFWKSKDGKSVNVEKDYFFERKMLVYIDRNRTTDDKPKKEYIVRMNEGIKDAIKMGVPEGYVEAVMRRFIHEGKEDESDKEENVKMQKRALEQAVAFTDEN